MALAGLGIILMFIGRHIMIRDTGGDLPLVWIVVLRIVPFSELVYMVRHFSEAKTGGIVSIVGMWLLVPFLGTRLWEQQMAIKSQMSKFEQHMEQRIHSAQDGELTPEMRADMSGEAVAAWTRNRAERLKAKTEKVTQVNAKLQAWFTQLQTQRAALTDDPAALNRFNAEAAAYASFNATAKEEFAELEAMQAKAAGKR